MESLIINLTWLGPFQLSLGHQLSGRVVAADMFHEYDFENVRRLTSYIEICDKYIPVCPVLPGN